MDAHDRFHQLLKRDFVPILRAEEFKGSGATFRRIRDDVIHLLNFQGHRYGGKCCVNLGLHYAFMPTTGIGAVPDTKKLREYDCAFRDRLHEANESDHWWAYGATDAESEASVVNLIDMYRRRGDSFFKKFEPFPDVFQMITPAELDAGDLSKLPTEMTQLQASLVVARIMNHLGRNEISRQFAVVGLRHIGRAVGLKPELEHLRDAR